MPQLAAATRIVRRAGKPLRERPLLAHPALAGGLLALFPWPQASVGSVSHAWTIVGSVLSLELVLMIVLLWVAKRTSLRRVARAGQFATLAELSQRGFGTDSLSELFDLVVSSVGRSLGVELVELLELQGKQGRLALRAGRGFHEAAVESEVLDLAHSFRVAHALDTGRPVVMGPGDEERRLYRDPWLVEEGVRSG